MFVSIQHPFADLRDFVGPDCGRLKTPQFPILNIGSEFVRSSGPITDRRRGGVAEWGGEESFARADNALRFPNNLSYANFGYPDRNISVECLFRRFYSNGRVARWEVGFDLIGVDDPLERNQFCLLLYQILGIPVRVGYERDQAHSLILVNAGKALANQYLVATSRFDISKTSLQPWWFQEGDPMLLVELQKKWDANCLPPHTKHVLYVNKDGIDVFHCWLRIQQRRFSAWFLIRKPDQDPDLIRRLRIHLVRLHSERHCLGIVLQRIRDQKLTIIRGSEPSDAIQEYLNDATHLLERPTRNGIDQMPFLSVAKMAFDLAFEGENASLNQMRRQVHRKVQSFIEREQNSASIVQNLYYGDVMNKTINMGNVSVDGDFTMVTAENIQNSYIKAGQSSVSTDLREALKTLSVQVAELAKQLPPEKAEQAAADLHSLISEAVSKQPRQKWYELSASGLIEAAKTVGEMLPSISASVQTILKLISL